MSKNKNKKLFITLATVLTVSVTGVVAFQEPTEWPAADGFKGFLQHLISGDKVFETVTPGSPEVGEVGLDTTTGDVDSSQVVQNPDGDLLERVEFIQENMLDASGDVAIDGIFSSNRGTGGLKRFFGSGENVQIDNLASGNINFGTGGNQRMTIDVNGNVGIGTTTPAVNLDIYNSGGWGGMYINGASGGDLQLQVNGTTYGEIFANAPGSSGMVINAAGADNDLHFQNAGVENMTLLDNGNVGIGTATPSVRLDVDGWIKARNSLTIDGGEGINSNLYLRSVYGELGTINSTAGMHLQETGTTVMTIDAGNVGIGTTAPSTKLTVQRDTGNTSGQGLQVNLWDETAEVGNKTGIAFTNSGSSDRNRAAIWMETIDANGSNGDLIFAARYAADGTTVQASDERMRIRGDGNVGIGTTSPSAKLHVKGSLRVEGALNSTSTNIQMNNMMTGSVHDLSFDANNNSSGFFFRAKDDAGNLIDSLGINRDGNVGVGTRTPNSKLEVAGTIHSTTGGVKFPDGTMQTTAAGGGVPSGAIMMFETTCPTGWTRFDALDGKVAKGAENYGAIGGADTHSHALSPYGLGSVYNPNKIIDINNLETSNWPPYLEVIWCQKD